ncbi:calcium-binding protein [Streptomyces sp. NBC_00335]|uniref:calcium-binding protein n=1 Tax=unclassified Streptomyces TaxID=2593676 RepID=UPI0022544D74|nr:MULTISPECIES: calcium-binding protein [unclassified Streptomyces]MCX5408820.1 calcium-binding protein [Streptomyces sp. NBC_00086]
MTHAHPMPPEGRRRPARAGGRAATVAAAALTLLLALPGTALAAPGDLDPSFADSGRVQTYFPDDGGPWDYAEGLDVARQGDGKLVVAGRVTGPGVPFDMALIRYNANGSVDTGFGGGDGRVTSDFGGDDQAEAVAVQPSDGKIVVAGRTEVADEGGGCCFFSLARYNTDGSPDQNFGTAGLVRVESFGNASGAADLVVQPDGKILAVGLSGGAGFALARLNADGSPDPSFGGDGTVVAGFAPAFPGDAGGQATGLALQPDGRFVAVGSVGSTAFDFGVARYLSNGSLDTSFSGDGMATADFGGTDFGRAVAVRSDGAVVAAGTTNTGFALARFTADGSPDPAFGTGGRVTTVWPLSTAVAYDMTLQQDGKILVGGTADDPDSQEASDFALARYLPNGTLDTGFGGGDGRVYTGMLGGEEIRGLLVQPDGKIVAAGLAGLGAFGIARYEGGGSTPPPPAADLSVTKTGTTTVSIGDQASYTVRVTNASTSTATATGVTLTDTLSGAGGTLLSAVPSQGTCTTTATSANCVLGSLAPGASATVTVTAEPRATGTLTNTASATATPQDPNPANNSAGASTSVNNSRGCTIIGTSGTDTLNGGYFNDIICALSGNDTVRASYGNDTVHGGPGNDNIDGGFGDDTLSGGPGNDTLTGYYGNDRLTTTDGVGANDTADGGMGSDTCTTDPGDTRISCP